MTRLGTEPRSRELLANPLDAQYLRITWQNSSVQYSYIFNKENNLNFVFRFLLSHILELYMCFTFYIFFGRLVIDTVFFYSWFYKKKKKKLMEGCNNF